MILSDIDIEKALIKGDLIIDPWPKKEQIDSTTLNV